MFLRIVFFLFASYLFGDLKKDLLKISVQTQVESIVGWYSKEKTLRFLLQSCEPIKFIEQEKRILLRKYR